MILAAPPAAAIRYVKDSNGLEPSSYAGGGSLSSSFFDDGPFISFGSAAFVSLSTSREVGSRGVFGSVATGAYAGTEADAPASVTADLYA